MTCAVSGDLQLQRNSEDRWREAVKQPSFQSYTGGAYMSTCTTKLKQIKHKTKDFMLVTPIGLSHV